MKIDGSQSNTLNPYPSEVQKAKTAKNIVEPALTDAATVKTETKAEISPSSGDTERIKNTVKRLLEQSDIRPQVVESRSPSDPAKVPTNEELAGFVEALRRKL